MKMDNFLLHKGTGGDDAATTSVPPRKTSTTEQSELRDTIYKTIADFLWNKVFYMASLATEQVNATVGSEYFLRDSDTTNGKYFSPTRKSRFKMSFYILSGNTNGVIYITSPAISTASTIGTIIQDTDKSFVGIKIDAGDVYLCSYSPKLGMTLVNTDLQILDNETHTFECEYTPGQNCKMYLDGEFIGAITSKIVDDFYTFFTFLISVKSNSGTVSFVYENYEFMQDRV